MPPDPVAATCTPLAAELKARQSSKIREIGDALVHAGLRTIGAQAQALGLSRSTTWAIFQGQHKGSGLSSSVIERMLKSPQLPALVRGKILEYVEEKSAGLYGGSPAQRRKFAVVLAARGDGRPDPAGTSRAPAPEKKAG